MKPITLHTRPGRADQLGMDCRRREELRLFVSMLTVELVMTAETFDNQIGLKWKTVIEVVLVLTDECAIRESDLVEGNRGCEGTELFDEGGEDRVGS